ncbi:hypothetical protein C0Q70_07312 [Pomacea canaliculata]|uniref:Short-chain dehydrogenase/reductase 3 n=2 Tax=Pomacea canaliculata TaxID=400727 RepID=A0A2T7PEN9_POMCA|nr:hypothetical protein C0Q70_07312 [Pomacea canaliculata]
MADRFARLNCKLVLWDVNEAGLEEVVKEVRVYGVSCKAYAVDLSSRELIYAAAEKVKAAHGHVDILVNNAGIVTGKKFLDCSDSMIEKTMDVNANAHFWTVKAFLPDMMKRNSGHIVSIASSAGLFGVAGLADYCASKFAAVGFMESMRAELAAMGLTGIHTTVVCPYFINTGMFDGVRSKFMPILDPNETVDRIVDAVLCNQAFLIIPRSLYLTYAMRGFMPVKVGAILADFLGVNESMTGFQGRLGQKKGD